jgi:hypothetical protein
MRWARLFIVADSELGLTAEAVNGYLAMLAGPGSRRLGLTDGDIARARAGGVIDRIVTVPHAELSPAFRAFLRPGASDPLPVAVHVMPWMRQTGTGTVTLDDGTTMETPVVGRIGTLVDVLVPEDSVDVAGLEAALRAALPAATTTRSDGSALGTAVSPIGLGLVPASEVRTPSVTYPGWTEFVVGTEPIEAMGSDDDGRQA